MNSKEHADLEEWARTFGGTAILGFISTLLLGGKLLHHVLSMRGGAERALSVASIIETQLYNNSERYCCLYT